MKKLYSIILLILSIFMIEQPAFSEDGCGKGSKKGKNGLCHVKKKKKKNSDRQKQSPKEKQIEEEEEETDLPEKQEKNLAIIPFKLIDDENGKNGSYNQTKKIAMTLDGMIFTDIIEQRKSPLKNNLGVENPEDYELIGFYTKNEPSINLPKGTPTFAPIENVTINYYLFGKPKEIVMPGPRFLGPPVQNPENPQYTIMPVHPYPGPKYPNPKNSGRPYGDWRNDGRPEPRPMNPALIVEFTIDPKLSNNKKEDQGTYNMVTKTAKLPNGKIFSNIIEQQSSELNSDSVENVTNYQLIGSYSKEKLYEKPKGGGMSIALHSSQETYYLFGIRQK